MAVEEGASGTNRRSNEYRTAALYVCTVLKRRRRKITHRTWEVLSTAKWQNSVNHMIHSDTYGVVGRED